MRTILFLLILGFFSLHPPAISQTLVDNNNLPNKLGVFIDGCEEWDGGCDLDYIRTEITAVDFYRDNQKADVFLLINRNRSGGGENNIN
ncbi:hypothetical protein [Muriicola jejuensis]|uniref:hypothetical protein n=1 Tax=Muriicola jejuensis TaxID=504488 RepID=UPI001953DFB2|nr:hypothetical protein [Muriicola jejuensis]